MANPLEPRDFLLPAKRLANNNDDVSLRTAVGRAYYALFLIARDKLRITNQGGSVHQEVVDIATRRKLPVGNQLKELRRLRNIADYDLIPRNTADLDWSDNWKRVEIIALTVLAELETW